MNALTHPEYVEFSDLMFKYDTADGAYQTLLAERNDLKMKIQKAEQLLKAIEPSIKAMEACRTDLLRQLAETGRAAA